MRDVLTELVVTCPLPPAAPVVSPSALSPESPSPHKVARDLAKLNISHDDHYSRSRRSKVDGGVRLVVQVRGGHRVCVWWCR